jgi:hypothetical protein
MDKIKDEIKSLLAEMGAKEGLVTKLLTVMENYQKQVEERVRSEITEEFKQKVSKAKEVCLEELKKEKLALGKKVEIFLEARTNTIDKEARKQAAIGESVASKTLRDMKSLIEGVEIGGEKDTQVTSGEVKKLRVMVHQLQEDNARQKAKAQRANEIALKVLERNKILEGATAKPSKPVTESAVKTTTGKQLNEIKEQGAKPQTSRPATSETIAKQPEKKTVAAPEGEPEIMAIANEIGEPSYIR